MWQVSKNNWIGCWNIGLFRTESNIYDGAFCESSYRLKAANYFCKTLHQSCEYEKYYESMEVDNNMEV